ncbi:MAG: hypothetical protein UT01_C0063G0010 [Candidatus Daviesbacteria bacterium GW2011_GWA1_38_7]|nr:MAG: hypothetical protein UT01_C0063G0010 [Candidatus Daviesbacteria bacterium GW2011_GWA1_38_7]
MYIGGRGDLIRLLRYARNGGLLEKTEFIQIDTLTQVVC